MLGDGAVLLSTAQPRTDCGPAIDPLFVSAARWCGARVDAIVLRDMISRRMPSLETPDYLAAESESGEEETREEETSASSR
jgi:hypothetical protein